MQTTCALTFHQSQKNLEEQNTETTAMQQLFFFKIPKKQKQKQTGICFNPQKTRGGEYRIPIEASRKTQSVHAPPSY